MSANNAWAPADWIALAGVIATALGALATLGGVWLGASIATRDVRRRDAETTLVAIELALRALDVEDLDTEDLIDDSRGLDNSTARMARISTANEAGLAHEAIAGLITRRNKTDVIRIARELDARLSTAQQLVTDWYGRKSNIRHVPAVGKDKALAEAAQSLVTARRALNELRSKADELRGITIGS